MEISIFSLSEIYADCIPGQGTKPKKRPYKTLADFPDRKEERKENIGKRKEA